MKSQQDTQDTPLPFIIIIGNEKGGAGKTTTAMHLIVSLICLGFKVACLDADVRQRSLTRYIENRTNTKASSTPNLPLPRHFELPFDNKISMEEQEKNLINLFDEVIKTLDKNVDFIIVDTPGNDTKLSRYVHSKANMIITPMNDSFIDLDVIAKVNSETLAIEKPTHYSQMIWEVKMRRAAQQQLSIEWVVLRNRLSNIDAKNKRNMSDVLDKLSGRIGFRHISGFSERVIFRELFLNGLTLLDLDLQNNILLSMSHVAARQELRNFLRNLNIKKINDALIKSDLNIKNALMNISESVS